MLGFYKVTKRRCIDLKIKQKMNKEVEGRVLRGDEGRKNGRIEGENKKEKNACVKDVTKRRE